MQAFLLECSNRKIPDSFLQETEEASRNFRANHCALRLTFLYFD